MTWVETECIECGCTVTYGIYFSDCDHEDTEINVTAKCGYCVNGWTEEDIASEKEDTDRMEFFERCMEDDQFLYDYLVVAESRIKDNTDLLGTLNLIVDCFHSCPKEYKKAYADAFYNIIITYTPKPLKPLMTKLVGDEE